MFMRSPDLKIFPGYIRAILLAFFTAGIVVVLLSPVAGCGDSAEVATNTANESVTVAADAPQDRAALLAAESQLRNAQMAQEAYYAENERYARTTSELKTMDTRLNPKVEVTSGGGGYEMQITAGDSAQTVYIIRKTGSRIERVDEDGNSW